MGIRSPGRPLLLVPVVLCALLAGGAARVVQDQCGPFTDVTPGFCPYVLELYYLGVTAGTSATTFSPDDPLTRGQGAVFIAKGLNQSLARSSRRAALGQWWTTQSGQAVGLTSVGSTPVSVQADGQDVWVLNLVDASLARVRASDGRLLETWTNCLGIGPRTAVVVAMGRVFTTGDGNLYMMDPSQPAGSATTVATLVTASSTSLAFDGEKFWITDATGHLFQVTPSATTPWPVQTVDVPVVGPNDIFFDGSSIWISDQPAASVLKLNADGSIAATIPVGGTPEGMVFDGANLWVPVITGNDGVVVIQAATGVLLQTLTGNGLVSPLSAAFDGQRILVTNVDGNSVSLWRAADLAPLGSISTLPGAEPRGVASDGVNFWIALGATNQLARF